MVSDRITNVPSQAAAVSLWPASDFFQDLVIACASVGVAHIDLIEHVIECLPIVHLAIQTA